MKKKGFTLVELLAVIVILAVIALIATPQILRLINGAREDAAKDSMYGYIKAVEQAYVKSQMEINAPNVASQQFTKLTRNSIATSDSKVTISNMELNGTAPTEAESNIISFDANSAITCALIKFHNYYVYYNGADGSTNAGATATEAGNCKGSSTPTPTLSAKLVVSYDKDTRENDKWLDKSGNGNDGVIHDAEWTEDGLKFNGTSSWVGIKKIDLDKITLEVTFKNYVSNGQQQDLIANFDSGGYAVEIGSDDKLLSMAYLESGYKLIFCENKIQPNQEYHVIYTYDGSKQKIYVNGKKEAEKEETGQLKQPDLNTIWALGTNPRGESAIDRFFNGTISSVKIYDGALTEQEIESLW